MKKSTKFIISTTAIAALGGAIYLALKEKKNTLKLIDECETHSFEFNEFIIGYNSRLNKVYYQTKSNNIVSISLDDSENEEICNVYIPEDCSYSRFSILYSDLDISYVYNANNEGCYFLKAYDSETGEKLDTFVHDEDKNIFVKL